jgi:PAS domain S-box-containing protein
MTPLIRNFIRRLKAATLTLQVLLVMLAFALMVVSSYIFVSGIEHRHLANDASNALSYTQAHIESDIRETETMLDGISHTIRGMLRYNVSLDELLVYMEDFTDTLLARSIPGFGGLYGHLDAFGWVDAGGWGKNLPEDYVAEERPWYRAAVEAGGNVAITDPYRSFGGDRNLVLTFARRIFDHEGRPLGVIAMDMNFERITQRLAAISLVKGSYAVLNDRNVMIIAHPKPDMIGKNMSETNIGLALLEEDLQRTGQVSEREVYNSDGEKVVAFFKSMENGWQIGVITPKSAYYKNIFKLAMFLSSLGALLALLLGFFLLRASKAKQKADEFTRVMFKAMPLACHMWNKNLQSVMCNDEAIRVYRATDTQYFLDNFFDFSPPRQPDGRPSKEKGEEYLKKGFEEGDFQFEWIHRRGNGEDFPCEITMVRAVFNGEPALLTYTRDLSEEKAARAKLREADERIKSIFDVTPLAITMWDPKTGGLIDCNLEAVRVVGMTDKKTYMEKFAEMSPEYQPNGQKTADMVAEIFERTMKGEICRYDWIQNDVNGEAIPFAVHTLRLMQTDGYIVISFAQDMRDINAAIAKMRQTDELTILLFKAMPLACHMWTNKMQCVMCNDEAVRLYGVTDRERFLNNFSVDFSPEFQPCGKSSKVMGYEYLVKAFEDGYIRFEWVHRKENGEEFPCEIIGVRAMYNGEPVVLSYTRDLSKEKAALEKIREADERRQSMFDAAPLGITLWAPDGAIIDCNMEAVRVVGQSTKDEYIEEFAQLLPEYQSDGRKTADKLMETLVTTFRDGGCHIQWDHNSVSGEVIPFDITTVRLKHKGGYIAASYARDMREVNAAIAKMREADERAQVMVDATPVSCTLLDENFNVIDCNNEALKMLGLSEKSEYVGHMHKFSPEYQPDGEFSSRKFLDVTRKALEDGYLRFEWTHMDAKGEPVPCEVTLVRVKHGGRHVLAGYARDLREVKAMIKEMHRAEIAEESNQAKSKFLAAMSHEIRTPMNVILGVTEIQLQDETLAPHVREAFVQVYNSSDLLLGIINDILDLSKIEAEKMEFTPAKYELASLINDTSHLNMMRNSKPIVFELSVDPNAPTNLYGDELRIKQILNNLLSNSFKFTEEGKIKLHVSVDESEGGGSDDVTLLLTVSDTGQGMSKEQLDMLFTEYTRFNLDANRTIQGTGLGMNITQRLVGMMGGKITVESKIGTGTTITVRLPQKRAGDTRIGVELAENLSKFRVDTSLNVKRGAITREYMPYGKVLIVDDVESNLYVAKGLMAPYGLTIDTANSGFEAVDKIKSGAEYDVIFMDHMMPKMDGIEATKIIREHGYGMPIVALTANAVIGQADMFLKNGFDDFISKPIDIRQLNAALTKLIRDRQPPEVIEKAHRDRDAASRTLAPPSADAAAPELLAVFARDAKRAMPILDAAAANAAKLSTDDLSLFTTSVHGLKAALANIGENKLSQTALALEKAGKSGDLGVITLQTANFIKALNKIVSKAEADYDRAMDDAAKEDENPEYLREKMALIAKSCRDYDENTVLNTLENLKKMSWTRETGEALMKISELLLHSEFDEAAVVAEKFK